eukprot:TRINITY_DN113841_c0_g1_i1.p1 TRINITY_DN113841_c0_g1~~TRINITY_DN113841_c0_g1_i1.p1  ORF type:complete len:104 (+),score=13.60 TRINITY_DN113841_c0_g1_i1:30-314(+)
MTKKGLMPCTCLTIALASRTSLTALPTKLRQPILLLLLEDGSVPLSSMPLFIAAVFFIRFASASSDPASLILLLSPISMWSPLRAALASLATSL